MNYLVKNTDYTLAYPTAEYITAGTKQITINGIGNYCGSKTVSYEITGGPAAGYNVYVSNSYHYDEGHSVAISLDGGEHEMYYAFSLTPGSTLGTNIQDGQLMFKDLDYDTGGVQYHYEGETTTHQLDLMNYDWNSLPLTANVYIDYIWDI